MVEISKHILVDWCHLCGKRSSPSVDVWYMNNAEHPNPNERTYYIRICKSCIELMGKVIVTS
jgi:hypothetical protein